MSKKNQLKQGTMLLSPENYIRQKARNLPIYECLVNADWEKSKMVSVVIARVHANGNITAGFFLVDLYCLGIKNTTYLFNYPLIEYKKGINKMMNLKTNTVSYELAHNIVYAGLDYASELGLNPHKEFTSLTRFILEEDTEDVELINIECGLNGKPVYVQGQFDTNQMVNRVIAQLERTVGKGNYDVILEFEENGSVNKYDEEEFEDDIDEFNDMTYEEKKVLFFQLFNSLEIENKADCIKLSDLIISSFNDLVDLDLIDELYDLYIDNLDVSILPVEEIPFELWGVKPGELTVTGEITDLFIEAYNLVNESTKQASHKVKELKKIVGDIPAVRVLELMILQVDMKEEERLEMILGNFAKFPDYPIFQLHMFLSGLDNVKIPERFIKSIPTLEDFFDNRHSLYEIEFMNYFLVLVKLIEYDSNTTKLQVLNDVIEDLDLPERIDKVIYNQIMIIKFNTVLEYFSKEEI